MVNNQPRTTSGKMKVNLALDEDAYELLRSRAPNRRSYGAYVSALIRDAALHGLSADEGRALAAEVKRLQTRVDELIEKEHQLTPRLSELQEMYQRVMEAIERGRIIYLEKAQSLADDQALEIEETSE